MEGRRGFGGIRVCDGRICADQSLVPHTGGDFAMGIGRCRSS